VWEGRAGDCSPYPDLSTCCSQVNQSGNRATGKQAIVTCKELDILTMFTPPVTSIAQQLVLP